MKTATTLFFGIATFASLAASSQAAIVVNEFDYDQVGADTGEFVELFNPDATPQDLTGLSLVLFNGTNATNSAYQAVALTGSIPAGGYYTIGNIASATVDFPGTVDFFQNGAPDSLAIFSGTVPTPVSSLTASSAGVVAGTGVVYEGTNTGIPADFTPAGATAADGDSNLFVASFQRIPNGTGAFVLSATPTPGAANVFAPIPEPATLAALGLGGLLLRRRRA